MCYTPWWNSVTFKVDFCSFQPDDVNLQTIERESVLLPKLAWMDLRQALLVLGRRWRSIASFSTFQRPVIGRRGCVSETKQLPNTNGLTRWPQSWPMARPLNISHSYAPRPQPFMIARHPMSKADSWSPTFRRNRRSILRPPGCSKFILRNLHQASSLPFITTYTCSIC
jgi:hypothetical protein